MDLYMSLAPEMAPFWSHLGGGTPPWGGRGGVVGESFGSVLGVIFGMVLGVIWE